MTVFRFLILLFVCLFLSCKQQSTEITDQQTKENHFRHFSTIKGALLATSFNSLEELKQVVQFEYSKSSFGRSYVQLIHLSHGKEIKSVLKTGVSEADFRKAGAGGFWERLKLAVNSPYFVIKRNDMLRVYNLSRRRGTKFGEGDVAFYDLAETMLYNIVDEDLVSISAKDLSEKGLLNTFNHITAQAFMTTIFSQKLADFVADTHERRNLPELISGEFTIEQLNDLSKGPVDNYVDMINNEWGQELGKELAKKYKINRKTYWTPDLMANYLNDIQAYYGWAFQFGFRPFKKSDELVIKFSNKINLVMKKAPGLRT